MNIKNRQLRLAIIINLLVGLLIYTDYLLPTKRGIKEKYASFYNVVNDVPVYRGRPQKEYKYILECKSGNLYYLAHFPEDELADNQDIYVNKTMVFSKVKSITVVSENRDLQVSFFSIGIAQLFFACALLITILNVFFTNRFLDAMLAIASVIIGFFSIVYLFYI